MLDGFIDRIDRNFEKALYVALGGVGGTMIAYSLDNSPYSNVAFRTVIFVLGATQMIPAVYFGLGMDMKDRKGRIMKFLRGRL
jgi:hypothetical protein